jgi:hypothetical protein
VEKKLSSTLSLLVVIVVIRHIAGADSDLPSIKVNGRAPMRDWRTHLYRSAVHRFLRESPVVDMHIVTQEAED